MSGGSFDYAYRRVEYFRERLEALVEFNSDFGGCGFSPETCRILTEIAGKSGEWAMIMKNVEWLVSGDIGEGEFHHRMAESHE